MANKTGWSSGRLFSDLAWHAGFGSELSTLNTTNCVMSSVTFANNTGLDQLVDISLIGTIASGTIAAGAGVNIWIAMLAADGTSYGDGRITTTPGTTNLPAWYAFAFLPIQAGAFTALVSTASGIPIPPGSFRLIAQNLVGFNFTTAQIYLRSYNQDLNAA